MGKDSPQDVIDSSEILAGIRLSDDECVVAGNQFGNNIQAVTWDRVQDET